MIFIELDSANLRWTSLAISCSLALACSTALSSSLSLSSMSMSSASLSSGGTGKASDSSWTIDAIRFWASVMFSISVMDDGGGSSSCSSAEVNSIVSTTTKSCQSIWANATAKAREGNRRVSVSSFALSRT